MSPRVPLFQLRCGSCLWLLSVLLVCRTAIAVPIYPGETVTLPGTNLVDRPELGGTVVVTAIVPFAELNNLYNGTIEISVVQHPLGSAGVEQYRILSFNASESGFEIVGLDSSYQTSHIMMPLDVDYFDDTPGDRAPTTASLPPDLQPDDFVFSSVRFNFLVPVTPGETSRTMFVVANADIVVSQLSNYGAGLLVRDPSGAISKIPFESFPVIIPEPASVVLLGTALLCIMAVYGGRRMDRKLRSPSSSTKKASALFVPLRCSIGENKPPRQKHVKTATQRSRERRGLSGTTAGSGWRNP